MTAVGSSARAKALVTAEMPAEALAELRRLGYEPHVTGWGVTRQTLDRDQLVQALDGTRLLICELEQVDETVLSRCPNLEIVASCRGNPVNVDLDAARRHDVLVLNTPGRNADSVADFTVGLILALQRRILDGERHLRHTGWNVDGELPYFHFRGHELSRLTVGLLGLGAIGRRVAARLTGGFGSTVLAHDPYLDPADVPYELVDLDDLFRRADVVSLHAPGSADRPLVGERQLSLLGPAGHLVNTARANLVAEQPLVDALRDRTIAGAALDVYWTEPLPRDHPLLSLDNALLTPHLAGAAEDVAAHHAQMILDDLEAWDRGRQPRNAVVQPQRRRTSSPPTVPLEAP
jgi:phosphoglycerate dehydrogenase-like enzyme